MLMALKVILGLIGGLLLFLGGRWTFAPDSIMREHDISASSSTGKNFLRGDIGGLLIGGAIAIFMFLYQGITWAFPIIVIMGSVILGRVVSLIADGKSKQGMIAIAVELVIIALIVGIAGLS